MRSAIFDNSRFRAQIALCKGSLLLMLTIQFVACENNKAESDNSDSGVGLWDSFPPTDHEEGTLEPGFAKIHLIRTVIMQNGEVSETDRTFTSSKAWIDHYPQYTDANEDAWGLWILLEAIPSYNVFVIFQSPGPNPTNLALGDGQGYAVSVDIPEVEQGGSSPFNGTMHITELSNGFASGDASIGVDVDVRQYGADGLPEETIRVESVAFNLIHVLY